MINIEKAIKSIANPIIYIIQFSKVPSNGLNPIPFFLHTFFKEM